jgi:hypothetical protein
LATHKLNTSLKKLSVINYDNNKSQCWNSDFHNNSVEFGLFTPLIYGDLQRVKLFRPKFIGEFMMRVVGISYFSKRCVSYYEGTEYAGHYEQLFREQIRYKGFEYSFLNLFRTDALGDYRELEYLPHREGYCNWKYYITKKIKLSHLSRYMICSHL